MLIPANFNGIGKTLKINCTNISTIYFLYCTRHSAMVLYLWLKNKCMRQKNKERVTGMKETTKYYVVKEKAVPEVLLKVIEAKRLMETRKATTIQEAVEQIGISRSSFYKYKDDIFQFHDNSQGTTLTMTFNIDDRPGILSNVLKQIADFGANILTIHQSIPINGIAALSISVQVLQTTGDISDMLEVLESGEGVHQVKILAKE